jgi:hypothetical protein
VWAAHCHAVLARDFVNIAAAARDVILSQPNPFPIDMKSTSLRTFRLAVLQGFLAAATCLASPSGTARPVSPDGSWAKITVRADNAKPKPGDTVAFKVTYEIQQSGTNGYYPWPQNLPILKWTATSGTGNLLADPRATLNRNSGLLTIRNLRSEDKTIEVTVTFDANGSFYRVSDTETVTVASSSSGGSGGGGGGVISVVIGGDHPSAILNPDFVHSIQGGGALAAGQPGGAVRRVS